jgi:Domain of unknown function (DUF3560)
MATLQTRLQRAERHRALAVKYRALAEAACIAARRATEHIPPGQPILVGHHSEKRHRRDLRRSDNAMTRALECDRKAKYHEDQASAIRSNQTIFSDDAESLDMLKEKLAKQEVAHKRMVATNKLCRKGDIEGLKAMGYSEASIHTLMNPEYSYDSKGFQHYQLVNSNARIKNTKLRIQQLEKVRSLETSEQTIAGVRIVINVEENRRQLFFDGKPQPDIIQTLKRNGFKWSPSNGCWQRHLANSQYATETVIKYVKENEK